jgi:LacI family transcriptional regulator
MYTMRDVARLAHVSAATVSGVLNSKRGVSPELAKRVKEAMEALKYQPDNVARSLRMRQTRTIGMVVADLASPFFVEMIRGVQNAAHGAGYSLTLYNTNDDLQEEGQVLRALHSRRVDGILLASTCQHAAQIPDAHRPRMVLVDRLPSGFTGDAVVLDNVGAARKATQHLIALGHKRIAIIAGRSDLSTAREREEGFLRTAREAHLVIPEELIEHGNFLQEGGYLCAMKLLRMAEPPTAIISCNYLMTVGLMRAIAEVGIESPREISIVGFDDFDTGLDGFSLASLFKPQLTTIRQPAYEMGRRAIGILWERICKLEDESDATTGKIITLDAELVVRGSTAPPS